MNDKFSWNRFCKVVAKDWHNMLSQYATSMLLLSAAPLAVWLICAITSTSIDVLPDVRLSMIIMGSMIAACMTPSRLYRTINLRNEGIYYAMLPASKGEKFVSMLLYSLLICPALVYVCSTLIDVLLCALPFGPYHQWIWQASTGYPFMFNIPSGITDQVGSIFIAWFNVYMWCGYIAGVAVFLFTATLFRKHKVIYTILWSWLISFVLSLIGIPVMMHLAQKPDVADFLYETFVEMSDVGMVNCTFGILVALQVVFALLFGYMAWRRVKRMPY